LDSKGGEFHSHPGSPATPRSIISRVGRSGFWRHCHGYREPAACSDGAVAQYRRLGAVLWDGASAVSWLITLALVLVLDPAVVLTFAGSRRAR
jgi:hypothetical protein